MSAYNVGDPVSIPGLEDLLEKEMAAHSSILAWKIPWTKQPGRLNVQSLAGGCLEGHHLSSEAEINPEAFDS